MSQPVGSYTWKTSAGDLERRSDASWHLIKGGKDSVITNNKIQNFPQITSADKANALFKSFIPSLKFAANGTVDSVEFLCIADDSSEVEEEAEEEWGIEKQSGFSFRFNNLEKKRSIPVTRAAGPRYRQITRGLNLQGTCLNTTQCVAAEKKHEIFIKIGMGEKFNIARKRTECKCPECGIDLKSKQIVNFGFWKCQAEIDGYQVKPIEKRVIETITYDGDQYSTFENGGTAKWEFLDVTTKPLN